MPDITITQLNTKGQLVIPKKLRHELGINPGVPVRVQKQGLGVYVVPVWITEGYPTLQQDDNQAWLDVLERTRGAWGPETADERKARLAQERKERMAVKRMREAW